ncbi:hypothetical protein ANN_13186 [Periplaneta americana]|uniref:Uncharacterized protein n=1 Tax=Periplaneta americana TaxID=6978 RepID=A0ABQ8TM69_PERAM|nr:hypothetical protein ANN_13186 [Periplaneta americana]
MANDTTSLDFIGPSIPEARGKPIKGGPPAWGLGEGLTTHHRKKQLLAKPYKNRVLVGRQEGRRTYGKPRRRWKDNVKMDLREVGYDDRDWINLAQDRDRWRAYVRAAMTYGFLKSHLQVARPHRPNPLVSAITSFDSFFGEFINGRVYATKPRTIPEFVE